MKRIFINETISKVGEKVKVSGWVHVRRDHGKIIFIDLRDRSGLLQVVFAGNEDLRKQADQLRSEWVVSIEGTVKERPENLKNPKLETGEIELAAEELEVLNEAKTPPFEIGEKDKVGEELRMEYRYLDLRDPKMQKNLTKRSEVLRFLNNYLKEQKFIEVETPDLTKGTPEGAREFVVPSRKHPGNFYVLPQSPQQFKQLLMVAGLERYFQIARCFRDEDSRGDRQPEFTQLDVEMSFVEEDDVLDLIEGMMIKLVETIFPEKKIWKKPFPRMDYDEVMARYNSDKPDLREDPEGVASRPYGAGKNNPDELAFAWVVNMPLLEYSKTEKKWVSSHHPFTAPAGNFEEILAGKPADIDMTHPEKLKAKAYDLVLNGSEIGGGSIRIHKRELQNKMFEVLGVEKKDIEARFGHMLRAFEYGAPPHGGIALGLDRLMMILMNEQSIREVIAFPKTGDDRDLLMGAPSEVNEKQLKELHISVKK
ncbi:MAG: aspartate--tRNA ligase [Parcubacteria group bacterium]|nr:aspartate--tRNA ligase [Parcubacteria group bacterium]